ncbi:MAG: type II secretion system protein [Patescibacteria group bacterium]
MNRGFSIVEVLVTLIVIGILLGLGTVGLRASLANARDAERQADIEVIARGLEAYYDRGNPYYIAGGTKGSYPGSNMVVSINKDGWCPGTIFPDAGQAAKYSACKDYWSDALPGVTQAALTPPGKSGKGLSNPWLQPESNPLQIMMPAITAAINDGYYVYKAMSDSDQHCYDDTGCTRYALIYKKETTDEVVIVRSKHQQ